MAVLEIYLEILTNSFEILHPPLVCMYVFLMRSNIYPIPSLDEVDITKGQCKNLKKQTQAVKTGRISSI